MVEKWHPWRLSDEGRTDEPTGNEEAIGRVIEDLARRRRCAGHAGDAAVERIGDDGQKEESGKRGGAEEIWLCKGHRDRNDEHQTHGGKRMGHDYPKRSRCARRQKRTPINALKKIKKLCWTNPNAAICPSFSGNSITQNVIAAARIGVGTAAEKKITGR